MCTHLLRNVITCKSHNNGWLPSEKLDAVNICVIGIDIYVISKDREKDRGEKLDWFGHTHAEGKNRRGHYI